MPVRRIDLPDEIRAALSVSAAAIAPATAPAAASSAIPGTGPHSAASDPDAPGPAAPGPDATARATPAAVAEPDYTAAFELVLPQPTTRSPEDWARAVFEGAPMALRRFIRAGWRFPLGFQLGPPGSPAHVLGSRIISADRTMIVLEQRSSLMTAHNIVFVERTRIVWTTLVRYQHPLARPLWSVSTALHHRILPRLLTRAAHT